MVFSGTTDKCKACDKTVHFIDMVTADNVLYHKTCFKCSHCNGKLVTGNYSSMDGVLYCKPHFEQLFKETGNFTKNFQTYIAGEKKNNQGTTPNKLAALFSGTQDKCSSCHKTVYPLEKVTMEGEFFHKTCFRCAQGGCVLTHSSYAALKGVLYCKHHFAQLFREKGSYSYINKKSAANAVEAMKAIAEKDNIDEEEEERSATPRAPAAEVEPIAQEQ
ncbi:LIM domain-containing protein PLIM2c [Linum grandiflorum]